LHRPTNRTQNRIDVTINGALSNVRGSAKIEKAVTRRFNSDSMIYSIFDKTSEIERLFVPRAISGVHIR
jgi:hypothetical protein